MTGIIVAGGVIFDDGVLRIARIEAPPEGLVLSGEADEDGYQPLAQALAQLTDGNGSGPSEVHLELSSLEFCDAAALHAMIAPAGTAGGLCCTIPRRNCGR